MARRKKIVEVKKNKKGTITHVRLEGNNVFADVSVAISLAKLGKINVEVKTRANGTEYLNLDKNVTVYGENELTDAEPATTSTPKKSKKKSVKKKAVKKKKVSPRKKTTKKE